MKLLFFLFLFGIIIGNIHAQEFKELSNVELFITKPGRNYIESIEINKPFKGIGDHLNMSYIKYKDLDNDSTIYGIRLHYYDNLNTNPPKIYSSILDMDEVDPLIKWINNVKELAPELQNNQSITHVTKKGSVTFGIFISTNMFILTTKKTDQLTNECLRVTFNKYNPSSGMTFGLNELDRLLAFLQEVKSKN